MPAGLTQDQMDCHRVICELTAQAHGASPSYKEIQAELDLRSRSGVHRLIVALERRGWIARRPGCARSIEILHFPPDLVLPEIDLTDAGRQALAERRHG